MKETKRYAIRCSTQEQARECEEKHNGKYIYYDSIDSDNYKGFEGNIQSNGYAIITYEDAQSMGLLGEKPKEEGKYKSTLSELKARYKSYIDSEDGDWNYKGANELFKIFLKELEGLD